MNAVLEPTLLIHTSLVADSWIFDSVLGKRVLTYWENRGNLDNSQMNLSIVARKN